MKAVKKWMWRHQRSRSWDGQESELRKADTESPTALGMTKSNERHGQRRVERKAMRTKKIKELEDI